MAYCDPLTDRSSSNSSSEPLQRACGPQARGGYVAAVADIRDSPDGVKTNRCCAVESTYMDGLDIPELAGAAQAVFARSAEAHARLVSVEVAEAREADGVIAVYLGPEVNGWPFPPRLPSMNRDLWRPLMAYDTVRFVGEPIALGRSPRPEPPQWTQPKS